MLTGKTIALLVAPRSTEAPEFATPGQALREAGAAVVAGELETARRER